MMNKGNVMQKYKDFIGNTPAEIRKEFGKEDGEFDVVKIAEELLGIEVIYDFDIQKIAYSGSITKKDDGSIVIWVNPEDSKERQIFTIAHEIGHVLNGDLGVVKVIPDNHTSLYRSDEKNKMEWAANEFAADLLMPADDVRKEIDKLFAEDENKAKTRGMAILAEKFGVSKAAMKVRLKILGIIKKK